jgi:hypothetical protein
MFSFKLKDKIGDFPDSSLSEMHTVYGQKAHIFLSMQYFYFRHTRKAILEPGASGSRL